MLFVFFKQKTAYEMRISDWSSDVFSSDLEGYIIAFLNLDRVIEIIRTEDEPKPVMLAEFDLTDRQAEAILNMRLRSLRKLEEMELRREKDALEKERGDLEQLLGSQTRQRTRLDHARTRPARTSERAGKGGVVVGIVVRRRIKTKK